MNRVPRTDEPLQFLEPTNLSFKIRIRDIWFDEPVAGSLGLDMRLLDGVIDSRWLPEYVRIIERVLSHKPFAEEPLQVALDVEAPFPLEVTIYYDYVMRGVDTECCEVYQDSRYLLTPILGARIVLIMLRWA